MTQAELATWLAEPMPPEVTQAIERLTRSDDVVRVAVNRLIVGVGMTG